MRGIVKRAWGFASLAAALLTAVWLSPPLSEVQGSPTRPASDRRLVVFEIFTRRT